MSVSIFEIPLKFQQIDTKALTKDLSHFKFEEKDFLKMLISWSQAY